MQIGQVIRKYRKLKQMTQEELANQLGVTASAVNKWENGNSFPDITLLAPIARLLGITLDTLLSFHEELTDEEIKNIVCEIEAKFIQENSYQEAITWAKEKITQYPNCGKLILPIALVFDGWRMTREVEAAWQYDDVINDWYVRALEFEDVRVQAADALFGYYMRKGQYEKAEEYLAYFSEQNLDKKIKQAMIYSVTDRKEEAYKSYEELLFSTYQMSENVFHSLFMLALQDKNLKKAHMLADKQSELARIYDMGEYRAITSKLELASVQKDVETSINIMEKMLSNIDGLLDFTKSSLYEHMQFKEVRKEFLAEIKNNLAKLYQDEQSFGFLKNDSRWQEIGKRLSI